MKEHLFAASNRQRPKDVLQHATIGVQEDERLNHVMAAEDPMQRPQALNALNFRQGSQLEVNLKNLKSKSSRIFQCQWRNARMISVNPR